MSADQGVPVSLADQAKELRREIRMRERVYPRQIADHALDPRDAARQMAAIRAALRTVEGAMAGARLL